MAYYIFKKEDVWSQDTSQTEKGMWAALRKAGIG